MRQLLMIIRKGASSGQWVALLLSCMDQLMLGQLPPTTTPEGTPLIREVEMAKLKEQTAGQPELASDISGLVFRLGFLGMLHLFKEVTPENTSYPEKRWQAFQASAELTLGDWTQQLDGDVAQGLAAISVKSINTKTLQQAARRVDIPKALKLVLREADNVETPYKELYKQLLLVAEFSGMSAIKQMFSYASNPTNLAIVISSAVLDEAERFLKTHKEISDAYGPDFSYLRILNPAALSRLSAAHFSDLYYVAVESAKSSLSLNAAFQVSQHPTITSKDTLRKWVKRSMVGVAVSEDRKRRLTLLGINPEEAMKKIQRLEKREEDE